MMHIDGTVGWQDALSSSEDDEGQCREFDTHTLGRTIQVTEIQRFSLQDGPGIRTTIFLKGCPLRCPWCHNPETQDLHQELYYYRSRCTNCGRCAAVCPSGASTLVKGADGRPTLNLDRSKCEKCMRCVSACLSSARAIAGQSLSIDDILREALSDRLFYDNSGGGVTLSGGDPLRQPEASLELARRIKAEGVHVAMETSCFPKRWQTIEPLLEVIDLFIVDLKTLDAEKHEKVIRWPLAPILRNLDRLIESGANVRIHIPIIPGFNDSEKDFADFVAFLSRYLGRLNGIDILNYHSYAASKYDALGRGEAYAYREVEENPPEKVLPLAQSLKQAGFESVTIGGLVGITTAASE